MCSKHEIKKKDAKRYKKFFGEDQVNAKNYLRYTVDSFNILHLKYVNS